MKKTLLLKTIILLTTIILGTKTVAAQTPFYLMSKSGTLYNFTLEEKPRFWKQGRQLYMQTKDKTVSFTLNNITQIFWDNDIPSSISETLENKVNFVMRNNKLYISGVQNSTIYIYSLKGILCAKIEPTDNETEEIDINSLANGTYLVRISDFTFKFTKQ